MLIYGVSVISALVCFCALLLDVGLFERSKAQLQTAADAAAIGSVFDYQDGGYVVNAAIADAGLNGFNYGSAGTNGTLSYPPATGAYTGNNYAFQVTVSKSVAATFLPKSVTVSATATAMRIPPPCVYMLSKATTQVSFQILNQTNQYSCPTYLGLSYNLSGVTASNSQYFVARNAASSSGSPSPAAIFGAPTLVDPLGYVPPPTPGTCTQTNYVVSGTTLSPGTYCGGLTINTSSAVALNAGIYIITGPLVINGPNLTGTGVTFYVTTAASGGNSNSSITNVNAVLSAPTSGTWQGILYYSDRSLAAGQGTLTMSNWNQSTTLDGIFYLPNQKFNAFNIPFKPVKYLGLVADYAQMNNVGFSPAADYSTLANGNPFHPIGGGGGIVE